MPNLLITGVPGAGKTLYALSEVVLPTVGQTVTLDDGRTPARRILIGGVRDLLIPHEPIDVPKFNQETGKLVLAGQVFDPDTEDREPGEAPHDCHAHAANWWRWCQPGDLIFVDECQNLFRPMAAGRKLPKFITELERHRHYGVDFVFVTQHPQLVHSNVRNLINVHRHVRRVFGTHQTLVYEWDHCSAPNAVKDATSKLWRHNRKVYSLYKSAEVHTKHRQRIPLPVYVLGAALLSLAGLGYAAKLRIEERAAGPTPPVAASAPAAGTVAAALPPTPAGTAVASASSPAGKPAVVEPPKFAGCIELAARCECIDAGGYSREVELAFCQATARRSGVGIPYPMVAASAPAKAAVPDDQAGQPVNGPAQMLGFATTTMKAGDRR